MSDHQSFMQKFDRLLRLERLIPRRVSAALGVRLEKDPEGGTGSFDIYKAPGDKKLELEAVELRVPLRPKGEQDGLLIIDLTGDPGVKLADLEKRFGEYELKVPYPGSPTQEPSYWFRRPDQVLKFQFAEDGPLRLAVIDRTARR